MLLPGGRAFLLAALAVSVSGQAVISTHSGLVHYFEGAVWLSGRPLESQPGRFPSMADGSELRTAQGRAEVLLTPGVILRLDQNSAIRMLSNSLDDNRIELLDGSALVEAAEQAPGTSVVLAYRGWQICFTQKGVYRIDSNPARVWVGEGEAQVTEAATGTPVLVERGMDLPLAGALAPELASNDPNDALTNWSRGRADSISADNQIAANIQDPATMTDQSAAGIGDPSLYGGFTQFPMIGLAPISPVVGNPYGVYGGVYSNLYPYQPGFYSLYLPGYTYRPLFLGLPTMYTPLRPGVTAVTGPRPIGSVYTPPRVYTPPTVIRPSAPATVVRPSAPISRPAPIAAPRVGGRR